MAEPRDLDNERRSRSGPGGRVVTVDEREVLAQARALGREIVGRFDEAFELGKQLLAPLRAGWLEALRTDVGVERKLTLG